jgi:Ferritin-like domain
VTRLTRRGLLGLAAAAAVARPGTAFAFNGELDALFVLMHREDAASAAYGLAALRTPDAMLRRIGRQDADHAAALRVELEALTVTADPPPPDAALTDTWAAPLAAATSHRAALAAALELEAKLADAYTTAARVIREPKVLRTVATIAGSHAQQRVALRAAAGRPPLDEPGVSGR